MPLGRWSLEAEYTHLRIIFMQHRIRILLRFFCFFFQFFFLLIFMILLSSFCCCLIPSFSSFFFLSSSFFIISRVAGLSAGPGRGDEVFLSCFPLGVSLGVYSDGDFSCFFLSIRQSCRLSVWFCFQFVLVGWLFLLLYVPSQQLWSLRFV